MTLTSCCCYISEKWQCNIVRDNHESYLMLLLYKWDSGDNRLQQKSARAHWWVWARESGESLPQRPSRAHSTENHRRVKYVVAFVDLLLWFFIRGHDIRKIMKFKSTKETTYFTRLRFSVLRAREGRWEGFSRFPSPHSVAGSDGFVPKSIVPTARRDDDM